MILSTLRSAFQAAGIEVETAYNGFNALTKIERAQGGFDALVTDLQMPGIDGFALIERCRSVGCAARIIVYAGSVSSEDRQQLEALGVHQIIDKPSRSSVLLAALKEPVPEPKA
jgi:two-component system, OmpR family, alkaline phosphatase synthesis response regulator PhoP